MTAEKWNHHFQRLLWKWWPSSTCVKIITSKIHLKMTIFNNPHGENSHLKIKIAYLKVVYKKRLSSPLNIHARSSKNKRSQWSLSCSNVSRMIMKKLKISFANSHKKWNHYLQTHMQNWPIKNEIELWPTSCMHNSMIPPLSAQCYIYAKGSELLMSPASHIHNLKMECLNF